MTASFRQIQTGKRGDFEHGMGYKRWEMKHWLEKTDTQERNLTDRIDRLPIDAPLSFYPQDAER